MSNPRSSSSSPRSPGVSDAYVTDSHARSSDSKTASGSLESLATWVVQSQSPGMKTPPSVVEGVDLVDDDNPRDHLEDEEKPSPGSSESDLLPPRPGVLRDNPRDHIPVADSSWVVHGNWCGPGWTGGLKATAADYDQHGGSWDHPAIDSLDAACRDHDKACADGGCSTEDDYELASKAARTVLDPSVPNDKALLVGGGMVVKGQVEELIAPNKPIRPMDFVVQTNPFGVPDFNPVDDDGERRWSKVAPRPVKAIIDVVDKFSDKIPKSVKRVAKWIPFLGTVLDIADWAEDADEHGLYSIESAAAGADLAVNVIPPLALLNDIYGFATDSDGFYQDNWGDPD